MVGDAFRIGFRYILTFDLCLLVFLDLLDVLSGLDVGFEYMSCSQSPSVPVDDEECGAIGCCLPVQLIISFGAPALTAASKTIFAASIVLFLARG